MAKGRKTRNRSGHRDPLPVASSQLVVRPLPVSPLLTAIEDRRHWSPPLLNPPKTIKAGRAKITVAPPSPAKVRAGVRARRLEKGLTALPREQHVFRAPQNVLVCIRRKIRAEVLHALRKTKSGRGGKRHRNYFSNVRC